MIKITPADRICTQIVLPPSKSISNRALIIDALGQGGSELINLSTCQDTQVLIKALLENDKYVDLRAAGTAMRFLIAYYSCVGKGEQILTGSARMKQRPVAILVNALKELGAEIYYIEKEGFPPVRINGKKLSGKELNLRGDVSSQFISALLMIAPLLDNGLTLQLTGTIISRPYIDLTLSLMAEFGAAGQWIDEHCIRVLPQPYDKKIRFQIENDWSAASYWYEIAALSENARIDLKGLTADSLQGDSRVAEIFRLLGVETRFNKEGIQLSRAVSTATKLELDLTGQPDLAQTLAVTCAMKNVPFRFCGLQSLRIKETDRITALIRELDKLGFVVKEKNGSELYWQGERKAPLALVVINTYDDHRMAMAFAPVCLIFREIKINHPEVVSKSYPKFWEDLAHAGFILMPSGSDESIIR